MTPAEILSELRSVQAQHRFEAMNAAMDRPEAVIPGLLGIVEEVLGEAGGLARDEVCAGPFPALLLLAQFREAKAFPLLQAILRLPDDAQEAAFDGQVSEIMPSLLASTCGGDADTLMALAADPGLDPFARSAAMEALLVLGLQGLLAWDRLVDRFEELFKVFETRGQEEDATAWALLACSIDDGRLHSLVPRLEEAFQRGWVDEEIISLDTFHEALQLNAGHVQRRFLQAHHLVEDAILDLERLEGDLTPEFEPEEEDLFDDQDEEDEAFEVPRLTPETIASIIARQSQRPRPAGTPSRNSPCPCGSGKKFKRCCGK